MANTNEPTILEVNALTGEEVIRPLTKEEIDGLSVSVTEEEIAAL
jgi:hypothetical protein